MTFAYDVAGRRTSVTLPNGVVTESTYDAASRVTGLTYRTDTTTLGTLTYTYDAAGHRVQVGGTWARTALPPALDPATYDAANRPLTFGGQVLASDLNGNLLTDGTSGYTWDARNRLTGITGPVTATFQYDAAGRRTRKTINGVTTDFVHDGITPVTESGASGTGFLLAGLGIDEFLLRGGPAGSEIFLTDALGSLVASTDAAGGVQSEVTYEPFGATETSAPAPAYRFTGREHDEPTLLYYYRARYYHPTLQRFISEDPIEFAGGDTNLYAYVGNNPLSESDPYGLFGIEDLPTIPQPVVDAVAGFGDSLSFSGTRAFRDLTGINDQVDQCSRSYAGGEIASFAVGFARIGYAGAAKALPLIVRSGSTQLERGLAVSAARNTLKQAFRLNPWSTMRIYTAEQILLKYGPNPAAIIAAATRTNALINRLGAGAGVGAVVNYVTGPDCKKSKSEQ